MLAAPQLFGLDVHESHLVVLTSLKFSLTAKIRELRTVLALPMASEIAVSSLKKKGENSCSGCKNNTG